jgi:hypothetical protein
MLFRLESGYNEPMWSKTDRDIVSIAPSLAVADGAGEKECVGCGDPFTPPYESAQFCDLCRTPATNGITASRSPTSSSV